MAVVTIKALLAVGRQVDQALAAASAESTMHAAAAAPAAPTATPAGQQAPASGR